MWYARQERDSRRSHWIGTCVASDPAFAVKWLMVQIVVSIQWKRSLRSSSRIRVKSPKVCRCLDQKSQLPIKLMYLRFSPRWCMFKPEMRNTRATKRQRMCFLSTVIFDGQTNVLHLARTPTVHFYSGPRNCLYLCQPVPSQSFSAKLQHLTACNFGNTALSHSFLAVKTVCQAWRISQLTRWSPEGEVTWKTKKTRDGCFWFISFGFCRLQPMPFFTTVGMLSKLFLSNSFHFCPSKI